MGWAGGGGGGAVDGGGRGRGRKRVIMQWESSQVAFWSLYGKQGGLYLTLLPLLRTHYDDVVRAGEGGRVDAFS